MTELRLDINDCQCVFFWKRTTYKAKLDFICLLIQNRCWVAYVCVFSMGGDQGHSKLSMPDWRQWKAEGTPLEFTQQRLAARGLKDPWARWVFIQLGGTSNISWCVRELLTLRPVFSPPSLSFYLQQWGMEILRRLRSCCDLLRGSAERI